MYRQAVLERKHRNVVIQMEWHFIPQFTECVNCILYNYTECN